MQMVRMKIINPHSEKSKSVRLIQLSSNRTLTVHDSIFHRELFEIKEHAGIRYVTPLRISGNLFGNFWLLKFHIAEAIFVRVRPNEARRQKLSFHNKLNKFKTESIHKFWPEPARYFCIMRLLTFVTCLIRLFVPSLLRI